MIIIEDIRYLDKFRPSETDIDWTLYNIGEPIDIEIDYRVEEVVIPESADLTESGYVTFNPQPSTSGQASNSNIIFAENSNAFENFYVGDSITILESSQNSNNGTDIIIEKINNQTIRTDRSGGYKTAFLKKNSGFIYVSTIFKGVRYYYNFIENSSGATYSGIQTNQEQQLAYDNTSTGAGAAAMVFQGNLDYQIGSATVEGNGTSAYGQKFTIKHSTVLTPLFLESQYADLLARTKPDYYLSGNCLKHIFKLEVNRDLSNPNDTQSVDYTDRDGNTGWFNESYNGQLENYTYSNLVITRVSDAATLTALELTSQCDATFRVSNTVDSPFDASLTKGMGLFYYLPESEDQYKDNGRTLASNFVYDYGLNTVATITNGNNYGTSLQAIEEVEITYVDADNIDVRIRFDFGVDAQSIISEGDFKRYLFGFTIEKAGFGTSRVASDKTTLLISTNEFYVQLFQTDLIKNSTVFLRHIYDRFADGVTTPDVFPVDDIVASSQFYIDFNGLESDGIDILGTHHELVLTHASEADILLESNTYSTAASIFEAGYIPLIDVEQNRSFTISDNDFRKLVTIKRDSDNDTGTEAHYATTYPFFVRWEDWVNLTGVNNPPTGVFDTSLPNNGLNQYWHRYTTLGYTLNYRLRFTIEQNGEQFTQNFDSAMTSHPLNDNSDWNNESIKSYDVSSSTELVSGSDKFLQGYVDTKLVATFDKTIGSLPDVADVVIVFWIIVKEAGTIKSVRRFSSFYTDNGDTWFKGSTFSGLVVVAKSGTEYTGTVLTDFTKLSGDEFTVYARLYDDVISYTKITESGDTKITQAGDNKITE